MNATVQPTDGDIILKTIVSRMNKLIKEKVDAVLVSIAQRTNEVTRKSL